MASVTQYGPTVTTQAVSNIDGTYATGNGTVVDAGVNYQNDGYVLGSICFGTIPWVNGTYPPYYASYKNATVTGLGPYSVILTGLMPGTTYYAAASAYNKYDQDFGSQVSFTTDGSAGVIDQSQTVSDTTINPYTYSGISRSVYQSFVADKSGLLTAVSVLAWDTLRVHAKIYTDNGSNAPGVLLAEDANLSVSIYGYENYQWRDLSFATPPTVASGTKYWIKFSSEGLETDPSTSLFRGSNTNAYANGKLYYYASSGGAWTEATNIDIGFKTYVLAQSSATGDILIDGYINQSLKATRNLSGSTMLSGTQLRKLIAYREIGD